MIRQGTLCLILVTLATLAPRAQCAAQFVSNREAFLPASPQTAHAPTGRSPEYVANQYPRLAPDVEANPFRSAADSQPYAGPMEQQIQPDQSGDQGYYGDQYGDEYYDGGYYDNGQYGGCGGEVGCCSTSSYGYQPSYLSSCEYAAWQDLKCRFQGRNLYTDLWVSQGFTWNPDEPASDFNTPLAFNDRANQYQLNQLYFVLGREPSKNCVYGDLGGRIDLLYGTDYFFTTAFGLEKRQDGSQRWNGEGPRSGGTAAIYGLAMPQVYGEIYSPWRDGLSIKLGHFYSIIGHESVMAPQNFFYSHSYSFVYAGPFTFTGALADLQYNENWSFQAGVTRGWDNWEDNNSTGNFVGGFGWRSCDRRTSLRVGVTTGKEDDDGLNRTTMYKLVFGRQMSSCVNYTLVQTYGTEENAALANNLVDADWYGVSQYLIYNANCATDVGLRFEWFRDEQNARVLKIPLAGVEGSNYYDLTLGVNHRPWCSDKYSIRGELRWDWSDVNFPAQNVEGMYNDFTERSQFTLAISALAEF